LDSIIDIHIYASGVFGENPRIWKGCHNIDEEPRFYVIEGYLLPRIYEVAFLVETCIELD
jgi:hypothetical protein